MRRRPAARPSSRSRWKTWSSSFENIANELRHQYNISYRPEPMKTDGLFHAVDLKVKNRKDLVVHVRKGYYAPKM